MSPNDPIGCLPVPFLQMRIQTPQKVKSWWVLPTRVTLTFRHWFGHPVPLGRRAALGSAPDRPSRDRSPRAPPPPLWLRKRGSPRRWSWTLRRGNPASAGAGRGRGLSPRVGAGAKGRPLATPSQRRRPGSAATAAEPQRAGGGAMACAGLLTVCLLRPPAPQPQPQTPRYPQLAPDPGPAGHTLFQDVFHRADKNDDGKLSFEEFQNYFADGVLSPGELQELFSGIDGHLTEDQRMPGDSWAPPASTRECSARTRNYLPLVCSHIYASWQELHAPSCACSQGCKRTNRCYSLYFPSPSS
ncbi:N-terminal EF-hand calcium-binding protein 3 isoform X6 [Pongo pygmaeus]|uniref:N-terminal EF-hand calcium-binding protein 3 isoform X6 n=1 Tax=Pongo pygmaeus TaxID=9600 RepID=UPI00300CAFC5